MPVFLNTADAGFETAFMALLGQKREEAEDVDAAVAAIIADVRARGDAAVIDLTARFDRLSLTPETLAFTPDEIAAHVRAAIAWTQANRDLNPANAVLIYAWNEHDEGGWLQPTRRADRTARWPPRRGCASVASPPPRRSSAHRSAPGARAAR